jgi:hypothetical protein
MVTVHTAERSNENDAVRDKKQKAAPEPLIIADSESVLEIVQKLVPKYYHELVNAHILCLCRNRASKAAGTPVPGAIRKANPTEKHLAQKAGGEGADYVLTVALDVWNGLQPNQRTALVDHLLARCVAIEDETTGEYKYRLRPPQVQEFPEIAARHGKWNTDLAALGDSLKGK